MLKDLLQPQSLPLRKPSQRKLQKAPTPKIWTLICSDGFNSEMKQREQQKAVKIHQITKEQDQNHKWQHTAKPFLYVSVANQFGQTHPPHQEGSKAPEVELQRLWLMLMVKPSNMGKVAPKPKIDHHKPMETTTNAKRTTIPGTRYLKYHLNWLANQPLFRSQPRTSPGEGGS